jgi:tetratricopeptide (TPR) repeat protein
MNILTGQKLVKQKEFGKALSFFLDLKKNNIKDIRIFFYLGIIYFELNNFSQSIYFYNKFLKKEPNAVSALYNLAIVNQSIGKIEIAKKIYLKLILINGDKIRPYYGLFTLNPNYLTEKNFESILQIKKLQKISLYEEGIIDFMLSKK